MGFVLQIFTIAEPGNMIPSTLDEDAKMKLSELREGMPFWHHNEVDAVLDEAKKVLAVAA